MSDTHLLKESSELPLPAVFILPVSTVSDRLDKILAALLPDHSRSRLQGWIEQGHVLVNEKPARVRQLVGAGDVIQVWEQQLPESQAFVPQNIPLNIVASSPDWIVVNKPAGLVTHPGAGNWEGTLLNGLLFHFPELAHVARAGIVHRLDKDTSGLLVVARHDKAQTHLVRQLQARTVHREYRALVHGQILSQGVVDAAIGRDPRVPVRMSTLSPVAPKPAVTHFCRLGLGELDERRVSWIQCRLETGRTHQIRVHLASLGHPLVGDVIYGGKPLAGSQRQMLHAAALEFTDPVSGDLCAFQAPLPEDMRHLLSLIEWAAGEHPAEISSDA